VKNRLLTDAATRRAVAGTSANLLLTQPRFWRAQVELLVILVVSAITFVVLAPYTYGSGEAWSLFSIVIQCMTLWGVTVSVRALAVLDIETAIVMEIEERGAKYLSEIKAEQRAKIDLDQLEETMVPNNPGNPPPAMIRLFQHVCKEAKDRRFDSSLNLIQPYREEALEDVFRLQNLQKIALWLGILGTFIGLLMALRSGNLSQLTGGAEVMGVIERMFGGLFISFTASVAGLEVAVVLGFLLLLLRKRQEVYFKQMETAVVTMLSVARHAINRDDFVTEFAQINTAVTGLSEQVFGQSKELEKLTTRIGEQTTRIDEGLQKLAAARGEFNGFIKELGSSQQDFIRELERIYDAASLSGLASALEASVKHAGDEVAKRLGEVTTGTAEQLRTFNASVDTLRTAAQTQSRDLVDSLKSLGTQLNTSTTDDLRAISAVVKHLQADAARHATSAQSLISHMQQLAMRVGDLSLSIGRIRSEAPPPRRRTVWSYLTLRS
jgi:methyl-accepting chemotaxis protein